jgi:hypothetical protein
MGGIFAPQGRQSRGTRLPDLKNILIYSGGKARSLSHQLFIPLFIPLGLLFYELQTCPP